MKKIIYTFSFIALFSIATKAQSNFTESKTTNKEIVVQDGNTKTNTVEEKKKEDKGNGTRMAINQKGVPASKATAKEKENKEDKNSKNQPVTEKP